MKNVYIYLIPALWLAWGVYWLIAAADVKSTARSESAASRAAHLVPLAIAGVLLGARRLPIPFLYAHVFEPTAATFFLGAGIVAGGLAFAVWARAILGRNWSGTVTLKEGHELIERGPYRLVRHPIYTGLLAMFLATAIARGHLGGIVAVVLSFASFWIKLGEEEKLMRQQFPDQYRSYEQRVKRIIPFVL